MATQRNTLLRMGKVAALSAVLGVMAAVGALGAPGCGEQVGTTTVMDTATTSAPTIGRTGTTAPESGNVRSVDWKAVVGVQPFVRDVEEVIYADLTGDGQEEALVLARLEGSGAYLDYYVYTLADNMPVKLFEKLGVSHGAVELGAQPLSFVETTAVYGPDDPNCCPGNLMRTTHQWSETGQAFMVTNTEVVPNPQPPSLPLSAPRLETP